MTRPPPPLVVTDCDEVLLHMVRHFRDWLGRAHGVDFALEGNPFVQSMRRRDSDTDMSEEEVWGLLGGFFDTEMDTQTPIPGAVEAINELQREADVVVLTNLLDSRNEDRTRQLRSLGIEAPVYTNQGPKGDALARILGRIRGARARCSSTISPSTINPPPRSSPHVHRLHFCGEPAIAPHVPARSKPGTRMPGSTIGPRPCRGCSKRCMERRDDYRSPPCRTGHRPARSRRPGRRLCPGRGVHAWLASMSRASCLSSTESS